MYFLSWKTHILSKAQSQLCPHPWPQGCSPPVLRSQAMLGGETRGKKVQKWAHSNPEECTKPPLEMWWCPILETHQIRLDGVLSTDGAVGVRVHCRGCNQRAFRDPFHLKQCFDAMKYWCIQDFNLTKSRLEATASLCRLLAHAKLFLIKKVCSFLASFKPPLPNCLYGNKTQPISETKEICYCFRKKAWCFLFCKNVPLKEAACVVTESEQEKCLQEVDVHMQFWFGQKVSFPPITQLQNELLFHPSILMALKRIIEV